MPVSVVIPNWNGLHYLGRLFEDLASQSEPPAEIILVDNASSDGSREWARNHGARVIAFGINRGFAAAVNAGVRESLCDVVAVLNNDLRLHRDWLATATAGIESAAFVVGKVLSLSDPERIDATYDAVCCGGTAWRCGAGSPDGPGWSTPRNVTFPPFTAVLVRREAYLSVGGLDERFESYLEDVEFGLSCASKGYIGRYLPGSVAWHAGSGTLGRWHARTVSQIARNQIFLLARHYDIRMLRRYGWKIAVAHVLWGALAFRHGRGVAWLKGKFEGLRRWREVRQNDIPDLSAVLSESEGEIQRLQPASQSDLYWRLYFALT